MMRNGVFYFGIPSFVLEIFKFLLKIGDVTNIAKMTVVMNPKIEISPKILE